MFHLLFEQSGTFKKEFQKLGFKAEDYDILNDFNETDHVIDLFQEIEKAYNNEPSIFDNIDPNQDEAMAFFPCIRFSNQAYMFFQGKANQMQKWSEEQKLEYSLKLHEELHYLFCLLSKLALVCLRKRIKLIIENPYSKEHYLTRYWCIEPKLIDPDRREMGDYFKKPTQYFFINREPSNNFIFEAVDVKEKKIVHLTPDKVERSMISPDYANRFIREYILPPSKEED